MRMRLDLTADAEALEERIQKIEYGTNAREYETTMRPFLEAYMKKMQPGENGIKKLHRVKFKNDGAELSSFAVNNNAKQSAIVAEYLTEVCNEPPRMHLVKKDTCPSCSTDMVLIPTKSIMTCPKCGISSSYLDATTSSISYGDEVEFASFSYKRARARIARLPPYCHLALFSVSHVRIAGFVRVQGSTISTSGCSRCRPRRTWKFRRTSSTR